MAWWKVWALCSLGLLAVSLATLGVHNDVFEFCTTQAYGLPLPWRFEWCECVRDETAINIITGSGNVLCAVVAGLPLAAMVRVFTRAE